MKTALFSHPVDSSTPQFGGKLEISTDFDRKIREGDSCNSMRLSFPNHVSTHIDAPFHFIDGGKKITDFDSDFWMMSAVELFDIPFDRAELIDFEPRKFASEARLTTLEGIFLRTGFESHRGTDRYWAENPGVSPTLAEKLRKACPKLRFLGMDFISATSYRHREEGRVAHREFLSREILFIEDMKLSAWVEKPSWVLASPLMLEGADGAPASVFGIYP